MTTWKSNLAEWKRDHERAQEPALQAAARPLYNAVKRNLRGGFKSGDFVTGASINAVTISGVVREPEGFAIRVGTNLLYNLFWTIGHYNAFTRKYERVDKWTPAFMDSRDACAKAYAREYRKQMKKWEAA